MSTVAKIFIGIVFVLANVFLGFTLAAVADRDDNPKYRYMRERWMREVVKFDTQRLDAAIAYESGDTGELPISTVIDSLEDIHEINTRQARDASAQKGVQLQQAREAVADLADHKTEITNFAATMRSFREALASVTRQYMGLQDTYQDAVRQFESLAVEREELKVERARLLGDVRSIEEAMHEVQNENAELSERIAAMVRQNPALPDIVRGAGKMLRGHVREAQEPPSEVVVIDIGAQHGVANGHRYSIYDQNTGDFKAQVVIMRTMQTTAIGRLEGPYRNVRININDEVRRSSIFLRNLAGGDRSEH